MILVITDRNTIRVPKHLKSKMQKSNLFQFVCESAKQAALLSTAADTLEWDERTGMPHSAGDYRAEQVSYLRGLAHQKLTDGRYRESLQELLEQISNETASIPFAITISKLHRDLQRNAKLTTQLVEQMAASTVRGQQQWDAARKSNRFCDFKRILNEIIQLKRESAELLRQGTEKNCYEALLDEYEPNATIEQIDQLFSALRPPLVDLIQRIQSASKRPDPTLFRRNLSLEKQKQLSLHVAEAIGFDFKRGRLDETSHPFCTTLGPNDCRILTRYDQNDLGTGLFGTIHEAGHGMYEQGLPEESFGLPLGSYASLGIHESQSRMWENQVGRSAAFWRWITPKLQDLFPKQYANVSEQEFYFAANEVEPSLIRVEADEATYNLHIIIRYDLEKQLINGELEVDDLPDAWNLRYEQDLGVKVQQDRDGVLQDVHWSAGLFGYFPTYTIGNLIAAQLFSKAEESIDQIDKQFSRGNFQELLNWNRIAIHRHGQAMNSDEIVREATGNELSTDFLVNYLRGKLETLYQL
jgi:carboxypeptidase Taq